MSNTPDDPETFWHPIIPFEHSYEIKKSEFICQLAPAADREAAMAVLESCRQQYPDARHHCWAYILGDPRQPISQAFSDGGEPAGTAGKPMLNVLQHRRLGNCMAVVSRYFGGVKLGAGGLVRAYSTATQNAVEGASLEKFIPAEIIKLACEFSAEANLRHFLSGIDASIELVEYQHRAILTVRLAKAQRPALARWLGEHFQIELLKS